MTKKQWFNHLSLSTLLVSCLLVAIMTLFILNKAKAVSCKEFVTHNHPIYRLKLPANPTTGYSWHLSHYDAKFIKLLSHHYQRSSNLIGASGIDTWTFKVKRQAFGKLQRLRIDMLYARPWQMKQGTRHSYYICVKKQHKK